MVKKGNLYRGNRGSAGYNADRGFFRNNCWLSSVPNFEVGGYLLDLNQLGVDRCVYGCLRVDSGQW